MKYAVGDIVQGKVCGHFMVKKISNCPVTGETLYFLCQHDPVTGKTRTRTTIALPEERIKPCEILKSES